MKITSGEVLRDFYRWWMGDITTHFKPDNSLGLCANLGTYTWKTLYRDEMTFEEEEEFWDLHREVQREMHTQFSKMGLNPSYPFNPTYKDYVAEAAKCACHTNPHRIQWVVSQIHTEEILYEDYK